MKSTDFIVARDDLQQCKLIETQLPDAAALARRSAAGQGRSLRVHRQQHHLRLLGDQLKYWQLFPAPEDFGNIPVWGFGEVIASKPSVRRDRRTPVRLFSDGDASRDRGRRRQQARPARRRRASPGRGAGLQRLCARQRRSPPLPDGRATIRRCCGRCSCCRFWSTIFSRENEFLRRTQRDALQRLQQDRVRSCASAAHAARAYPGDRTDLGGQCRFCQIARLLRRGRDL